MSDDDLARVKRAHERYERASRDYREALLAAASVYGYARVARELGLSRQTVRVNARRAAG